ncbi:unnamed protein product [Miscanthus lutarioriparius]|uniref:Cytochrome P450 n=1 Tax=Miscanthus lutarioriparius TaxID=422564 RepID=A0A811Q1X1_9POAL|nr:unnamed protein product [Miscanthus lutarioriparius]
MEICRLALIFLFLSSLLILVSSFRHSSRANTKKRWPPGPWAIPFVGSIHHMVTSQPQAALRDLAEKHGPVMYLRLGQNDTVVVSSRAAAQQVLQSNDVNFASRQALIAAEIIGYGTLDFAFSPYGDYWLHCTRMVIMETLRLHPILPLLVPHLCRKTCDIGGYEVSKGSMVGINAWATARNPKYWDNPEEFRPTSFENTTCDYKGSEFHYLPFGSGRRMCPGLSLGVAVLELIVARLLYYFDWSLPGKMLPEELDMDITAGATAKRRNQLHLVATPYDVPIPFEN